jgi:acetyltransferase-like isoleucine patch superfamily enzyme
MSFSRSFLKTARTLCLAPIHWLRRRYWAVLQVHVPASSMVHLGALLATRGGGRISVGTGCEIDRGAILMTYGGSIELGDHVTVNAYCVLYGHGGLRIGNGVRIAAHTVIVPANHVFADPDRYIFEQGETREGIVIEDDVWIGAGARIVDGVTIARGCVIGAGSVVTRSTQPFGVYVGVPARRVKERRHSAAVA